MSRHHAQDLLKMPPPAMTLDEAVARVERLREHIRHDTEMLDPDSTDADALSVLLAALRAPTAPERCEATSHDGHRCESRHGHEGPHWWGALTWWTPLAAEAGQQGPPLKSPYGHVWGKPYDDGYATCRCGAREDTRSRERCPAAAPTGETMSTPPALGTPLAAEADCTCRLNERRAEKILPPHFYRHANWCPMSAPTCGAGSAIRKDG